MNLGVLDYINCLSGLGKQPVKKPKNPRKRVKSRGDTELPPDSPEWMKKLAAADPEKWKRIIGGAIGDLYKLAVMAGLADAANFKDVGITEAHIFGGGKGRTGADGIPLTPEQESEFRRAMKFADSIYSVGMKIKDVKGMDKAALASALSEFLPQQKVDEIITQMNEASGGIKSLAIKTFLGAGDEGPMRRYFRARELAAEFQRQRDNATGRLSNGISFLTSSGFENLKNSLALDPKLLLSEVVSAPMAIANGVMDTLPSIPSLPEPSFTQVSKGKVWITGQDNGPISDIEPASVGDLAYDLFYTILKSEPPPLNANINSEKDLIEYGGTLLANGATPLLASRFVKKKALNAISNLGKQSSPVSISKEEKKIAKLAFLSVRKAIVASKNPNAMATAGKALQSMDASMSNLVAKNYNEKIKILFQQMKSARTIQELEDYATSMQALVYQLRQMGGDVPVNLQPQIVDLVQRKKTEIERAAASSTASWQNEADPMIRQKKMELSSLLTSINSDLISLESRIQTYKSFGGAAPDFSNVNYKIQQANKIASDIGRGIDQYDKSQLADYRRRISTMTNTVSTTTPIAGGGPGVSTGGNQPQNPYNYYPSSGGEMGPFPQTPPPVTPNYTIAGLKGLSAMNFDLNTILKFGGVALLAFGVMKKNKVMMGAGAAAAGLGWYRGRQTYSAPPVQQNTDPVANPIQRALLNLNAQKRPGAKINPILMYTMLKNAQN